VRSLKVLPTQLLTPKEEQAQRMAQYTSSAFLSQTHICTLPLTLSVVFSILVGDLRIEPVSSHIFTEVLPQLTPKEESAHNERALAACHLFFSSCSIMYESS